MSKKEQCKEIIVSLFGPVTGSKVDDMTEEECVGKCKILVSSMLGEEKAKIFDRIE